MLAVVLAAGLAGAAAPGAAGPAIAAAGMTVAEFLRRVGDGKVGVAGLINPRTRPALLEIIGAAKAMKAGEERAKAAGRPPGFCPPDSGAMELPQLVALLKALPPAQQQQEVRQAVPAVLRARFPCPALGRNTRQP